MTLNETSQCSAAPPNMSASRGRRRQTGHQHASDQVRIGRLADETSNLRAIAASPHPGWSVKRRLQYLEKEFEQAAQEAERSTVFHPIISVSQLGGCRCLKASACAT